MAQAAAALQKPYVGPVPFGIDHKDYFFGRDVEATLLNACAVAERIVLFYAKSGVGKTSLINTSLIPHLSNKYQVLPVIRVGRDLPPSSSYDDVYNVYTFNTLLSLGVKAKPKELETKTLADIKRENLVNIDFERRHWLILDQFEELVTTHPEQYDKRADFFDQLRELLELDKYMSVIFVMREDYLADIYDYAPRIPGRLNVRLRMTALRTEEAIAAIQRPAEKAGREFPREAARFLVEDLSQLRIAERPDPIRGQYVEPMQLQIVCYSFWERLNELKAKGEETSPITLDLVKQYAKVEEVLENYYNTAVRGAVEKTSSATEAELRRWISEKLITPTGIRGQVNRGLRTTEGLPNRVVDYLHEVQLLRVEDIRGGDWYELSHDRFISPIIQSNKKWSAQSDSPLAKAAQEWIQNKQDESLLYRGRQLQEAVDFQGSMQLSPAEADFLYASIRAEKWRKGLKWIGIPAVTIVLIFLVGYGQYQKSEYVEERQLLVQQREVSTTNIKQLLEQRGETPESLASSTPAASPPPTNVDNLPQEFTENSSLVGPVHWRLLPDGDVEYLNNWLSDNIIPVQIPQLRTMKNTDNGTIQFNKEAADQLKAAWAEVEAEGLLDRVLTWEGSFARKSIKGRLSSHALGLAFDINYDFNPSGVVPPAADELGSVRELVPIFKKYGFAWGGDWKVPDGGHFQVVRIIKRQNL